MTEPLEALASIGRYHLSNYGLVFEDRRQAGRLLAESLFVMNLKDPLVLAIPRGGVVVAYEIAQRLKCPLDVIIPRKVGAPFEPELAVGAVTEDGTLYLNREIVEAYGVSKSYLESESQNQIGEIKRRALVYRGSTKQADLNNKTVIIVDDGVATGATMKAAMMSVKRQSPYAVVIAVPVGAQETIDELRRQVDTIVCLHIPSIMYAIGEFYRDFTQTSDDEVVTLLRLTRT